MDEAPRGPVLLVRAEEQGRRGGDLHPADVVQPGCAASSRCSVPTGRRFRTIRTAAEQLSPLHGPRFPRGRPRRADRTRRRNRANDETAAERTLRSAAVYKGERGDLNPRPPGPQPRSHRSIPRHDAHRLRPLGASLARGSRAGAGVAVRFSRRAAWRAPPRRRAGRRNPPRTARPGSGRSRSAAPSPLPGRRAGGRSRAPARWPRRRARR